MSEHQKQGPVCETGPSGKEGSDTAIVEAAEKTGNSVKRLATLKAQFALRGFAVHEARDGFLVSRWNLTKHLPTLDDLERFARVVGAV